MTDYEFTVESEALENMLEAEQEEGRVLRNKVRNQDAQIITLQGQVRASYRDRDDALRALAESRARFADSEARRVELEAVIEKVRNTLTSPDLDDDEVIDRALGWIDPLVAPSASTVLGEHDQEVSARAWDEGFEAGATFVDHTPSGVSMDPPLNPYWKDEA